jgi:hypothetical protein
MIKFVTQSKDGAKVIGLGLEAENINRLIDGQPIAFDMAELGLPGQKILIMYGESQDDIKQQLRDSGLELPGGS